jgi:hypothetical protein
MNSKLDDSFSIIHIKSFSTISSTYIWTRMLARQPKACCQVNREGSLWSSLRNYLVYSKTFFTCNILHICCCVRVLEILESICYFLLFKWIFASISNSKLNYTYMQYDSKKIIKIIRVVCFTLDYIWEIDKKSFIC